ncbi:unnamed protein product, partial [Dovyalis caffra]
MDPQMTWKCGTINAIVSPITFENSRCKTNIPTGVDFEAAVVRSSKLVQGDWW